MKKISFVYLFVLMFVLLVSGCKSNSFEPVPYVVAGEFVMDENSEEYSICGVNALVLNKSEKNICSMNMVFFLFDRDGEPAGECQSMLSFEIEKSILGNQKAAFCVGLDKYMNSVPEEVLQVDYIYLSKIVYEDGSVWEDPYGLAAFR